VFGVLYAAPESAVAALIDIARAFSPRIEPYGPREVALDLSGLTRLFGTAREIGDELRRTAAARGVRVRVAIAGTRTAARLIVRHRAGVTVIEAGTEADAVAPLPITLLDALDRCSNDPNASNVPNALVVTLRRWGLRTLGEFAALAPDDVAARLGQEGVHWQRVACGDDARPLVPAAVEERFEQALDLEWPIEDLEPLSFVLSRLLEPLSAQLERRDRGAAVLHLRLHLVTRVVHERSLQLPAPMRDARTLRTLALLDLESHPPDAAIDRVVVAIDPTPGRVVQFSLLTRPLPSPEQLSTLLARLSALMGEGRCGSPVEVDSWQPGAFAMKPFAPRDDSHPRHSRDSHSHEPRRHGDTEIHFQRSSIASTSDASSPSNARLRQQTKSQIELRASVSPWFVRVNDVAAPVTALRRFRFPVAARVRVEDGKPVRVTTDRPGLSGGRVQTCAGPWRTSGAWWSESGDSHSHESRRHGDTEIHFQQGSVASTPDASSPSDPRLRQHSKNQIDLRASVSPWLVRANDVWNRDEWDVALSDGATYRVFRERDVDRWFVEGIVD